jgi:hypothetical protein
MPLGYGPSQALVTCLLSLCHWVGTNRGGEGGNAGTFCRVSSFEECMFVFMSFGHSHGRGVIRR